ncbi:hypothetical protein [Deinococcus seoulensis]|uniref:hypothetical protein n=1 Tax=Deinococcus seoulensis TaxID=1837379 RepID=UPI0016642A5B|nr:hypothetical protein [Deinococcus seoulensis]
MVTALLTRWRARRALRRTPPELRVLHALATGVTYPPLIASAYHLTLAQACDTLTDLERRRLVRPHVPRPGQEAASTLTRYALTLEGEWHAARSLLPGLQSGTPTGWKGVHLCVRPGQHLLPVATLSPITAHLEGRSHP